MVRYSEGFKARMIRRMSGTHPVSATALSKEVGVAQVTLSRWLSRASAADPAPDGSSAPSPSSRRTAADKARLVLEAEALSGDELGAFLRREGVYEAELNEWRQAMHIAFGKGKARADSKPEHQRIRQLEKELLRKEKALAELAALLALQKKARAYFLGEEDDDTAQRKDP
jgi:transposase-like protein